MNCRDLQGYISDRVLGEDLPDAIAGRVAEHLSRCESCRRRLRETERVWESLKFLESVSFPDELSCRVIDRVSRPEALRLLERVLRPRRLIPAAAAIVLTAAVLLLLHRLLPGRPSPAPESLRLAITFSRPPPAGPDLAATLGGYLDESEVILRRLGDGGYPSWGDLLSEIISLDIQGRSNFLLESPELDQRARSVVSGLHQAFWILLQSGRGREREAIELPPAVSPESLCGEIEHYRFETLGKR